MKKILRDGVWAKGGLTRTCLSHCHSMSYRWAQQSKVPEGGTWENPTPFQGCWAPLDLNSPCISHNLKSLCVASTPSCNTSGSFTPKWMLFLLCKNWMHSDLCMEITLHICILIMIFSGRVMNNNIAKYAYCHL